MAATSRGACTCRAGKQAGICHLRHAAEQSASGQEPAKPYAGSGKGWGQGTAILPATKAGSARPTNAAPQPPRLPQLAYVVTDSVKRQRVPRRGCVVAAVVRGQACVGQDRRMHAPQAAGSEATVAAQPAGAVANHTRLAPVKLPRCLAGARCPSPLVRRFHSSHCSAQLSPVLRYSTLKEPEPWLLSRASRLFSILQSAWHATAAHCHAPRQAAQ